MLTETDIKQANDLINSYPDKFICKEMMSFRNKFQETNEPENCFCHIDVRKNYYYEFIEWFKTLQSQNDPT